MASTETHKKDTPAANGTTTEKKTRKPAKALTAKTAGLKISAVLDKLPPTERDRAIEIAKMLCNP